VKVFRELTFKGASSALDELPARMEAHAALGWGRDQEREERLGKTVPRPMYCFAWAGSETQPAAFLWLARRSDEELYVANIVPKEVRQLTRDQYNETLRRFHESVAAPAASEVGVEAQLGSPDVSIDHWLSPPVVDLLRFFSGAANRSTGSGHPADRKRWLEFVFAAHKENSKLPNDMLRAWLIEEEGWGEEKAFELAMEYETARETLTAYDTSNREGGNA
jgi:hypothetical protein